MPVNAANPVMRLFPASSFWAVLLPADFLAALPFFKLELPAALLFFSKDSFFDALMASLNTMYAIPPPPLPELPALSEFPDDEGFE